MYPPFTTYSLPLPLGRSRFFRFVRLLRSHEIVEIIQYDPQRPEFDSNIAIRSIER